MEPRTRSETVPVLGIHVYLSLGNNNFVPQRVSQLPSLSDDEFPIANDYHNYNDNYDLLRTPQTRD